MYSSLLVTILSLPLLTFSLPLPLQPSTNNPGAPPTQFNSRSIPLHWSARSNKWTTTSSSNADALKRSPEGLLPADQEIAGRALGKESGGVGEWQESYVKWAKKTDELLYGRSKPSSLRRVTRTKRGLGKTLKTKRIEGLDMDTLIKAELNERQNNNGFDPNLVPEFGVQSGVNPDGSGNCEGVNNAKIPCSCPPDRQTFLNNVAQNVAAGKAVNNSDVTGLTFPTDDSVESQLARFNTAVVSLQNFEGPGKGCPQVATTWSAQIKAIQSGGSAADAVNQGAPQPNGRSTASSSSSGSNSESGATTQPAANANDGAGESSASSSGSSASSNGAAGAGNIDPSLVPEFGVQPGQNPDGTGNCEGTGGVKIPCTCPPDRQTFINDLTQNVAAGKIVNNPSVTGITFPSGQDKASVLARLNAATTTLQNLEGPGKGCPQAATTFGAQVQAAQNLPN